MSSRGKRYSREEALRALDAIGDRQRRPKAAGGRDGGSPEFPRILQEDHEEADEILLGLIGSDEISAAFERIGKWYS